MKCRICDKEIGNDFQLVCDSCTALEDKIMEDEAEMECGLDEM
jgi:hypothetical protein